MGVRVEASKESKGAGCGSHYLRLGDGDDLDRATVLGSGGCNSGSCEGSKGEEGFGEHGGNRLQKKSWLRVRRMEE